VSRVTCEQCGEAVNDHREVALEGRTVCRACAGEAYYKPL
jgi:formylmethanofuran dehydrogenase subunit E